MKVLFMSNIPSPYRVEFFNELGQLCDLTVLFESTTAKSRDASWMQNQKLMFHAVFMKGIKIGEAEAFCPEVLRHLSLKKYDVIVVGMYSSPTGMLAIEYMKWRHISFILNSDGGIKKEDGRFRHRFKTHFIGAASAWLSTGKTTTEYLTYYGAKPKNTYVYPFTSVSKKDILDAPLSMDEKRVYRKKLSMPEEKIVLSVGQFIYRKGYDLLLNTCKNLPKNIGIYIVGGKPTPEYCSLKEELGLTQVHFVDFMNKEALSDYYKAADLFLLPTREDIWGLVINEAMAYGLPILTTDRCVAGVEMVKGCGAICPIDANWGKEIVSILSADISAMSEKSLAIARNYSIQAMAKEHIRIFEAWKSWRSNYGKET